MDVQLARAVLEDDLPTVRRILQQPGVNVNARDEINEFTALHYAAAACTAVAIVQAILQANGGNADPRSVDGRTPLHMACGDSLLHANQLPFIQALLQAGADPNAAESTDGETPLFWAVGCNSPISVVEALLDAGANPAARNNNLDTPLHTACFCGQIDVVELLNRRQRSECLTFKNNDEETPLDRLISPENYHITAEQKISIRQHILQAYAGVLAQRDGLLCLHSVLRNAVFTDGDDEEFQLPVGKLNTEHLSILLEFIIAVEPGSVRALDRDGLLPLQVACQLDFPALVVHALLRPYPGALLLL